MVNRFGPKLLAQLNPGHSLERFFEQALDPEVFNFIEQEELVAPLAGLVFAGVGGDLNDLVPSDDVTANRDFMALHIDAPFGRASSRLVLAGFSRRLRFYGWVAARHYDR